MRAFKDFVQRVKYDREGAKNRADAIASVQGKRAVLHAQLRAKHAATNKASEPHNPYAVSDAVLHMKEGEVVDIFKNKKPEVEEPREEPDYEANRKFMDAHRKAMEFMPYMDKVNAHYESTVRPALDLVGINPHAALEHPTSHPAHMAAVRYFKAHAAHVKFRNAEIAKHELSMLDEDDTNWNYHGGDDDGDEDDYEGYHFDRHPHALHIFDPHDVDRVVNQYEQSQEHGTPIVREHYGHKSIDSAIKHEGHHVENTGERVVITSDTPPHPTDIGEHINPSVSHGPDSFWTHGPGHIVHEATYHNPESEITTHHFKHIAAED